MKVNFRVTGSLNIPDDAVFHKDVVGQLYAVEFNNKMHMLQVCFVAESPDGEFEMLHQYDEMQANDCLLYTSPSPRDYAASRMPSSA